MSSGSYDIVHSPAMYQRYEQRRPPGSFSTPNYDRSFNHPPRRRTPSPGTPRRFSYDSYTPNRVELPHRNEPPNTHRPNTYRPDYSTGTFYNRSPSPDRYPFPQRPQDTEPWDRPNTWHGPVKTPSTWQDRKPLAPSPIRERPRRDDTMATRIFEPSDAWKRDHVDRLPRLDGPPVIDRYPNYRRDSSDNSPNKQSRINRAPPIYAAGDRYRPPQEPFRDSHYGARPDSYRPLYEDPRAPPAIREPISSPIYRRDAAAPIHARNSNHYEPYHGRQLSSSTSVHGSASPGMRIWSPSRRSRNFTPSQERSIHSADELNYEGELTQRNRFGDHGDTDSNRTKSLVSRPSSRSSIASTLHSEKRDLSPPLVPPVTPQAQPNSSRAILASAEHLDSYADNVSPLRYPPDLRLINDVKQLASADIWVKTEYPIPSQAEDNEIILQDQSQMDLSPNQSQIQLPPTRSSDVPRSPSTDSNHSVEVPVLPPAARCFEISAQTALAHASAPFPPPSPLSASQFDPLKDRGTGTSTREIQVVDISPKPGPEHVSVESLVDESMTVQTTVKAQPAEKDANALASSLSAGPTGGIINKGALANSLSSSAAPSPFSGALRSTEAQYSTKEALRVVVMTRLLCDRQTREERISPVLMANLALVPSPDPRIKEESDAEAVFRDVMTGSQFDKRMQNFERLKPSLTRYLSQRQTNIINKAQYLRQQYIQLQESWAAHCHALNEQAKPSILEGETMPIGRTTRRSANLGDAVRSDLEMEQILASLENNDATDPNHLSQRNLATVPDMVCVTNGKLDYAFDDTSHRVEDPVEYYAPCTGIHDWTEDEKNIFLDRYAAHPKQFGIIADCLPNKTSAQCVDYYYLHKKGLIDFRKVVSKLGPKRRRRGAGKRKGNALLTDIQRHDEEVHRDSGSSSAAQSHNNRSARGRKSKDKDISESKPEGEKRGPGRPPSKRIAAPIQVEKTPTATPTPEPEAKARRRRVATAVASSTAPPSRTMSLTQDETEEDNPEPDPRPAKRAKRTRKVKSAATVEDEPTTPEMESTPLPDVSTPAAGKAPAPLFIQIPEQVKSAFPVSVPSLDPSTTQRDPGTASSVSAQDFVLPNDAYQHGHRASPLGHQDPSPPVVWASPPLLPPPSIPLPAPRGANLSPGINSLHSNNKRESSAGQALTLPQELSRGVQNMQDLLPSHATTLKSSTNANRKRARNSGPPPTGRPDSPSRLFDRIVQIVLPPPPPMPLKSPKSGNTLERAPRGGRRTLSRRKVIRGNPYPVLKNSP